MTAQPLPHLWEQARRVQIWRCHRRRSARRSGSSPRGGLCCGGSGSGWCPKGSSPKPGGLRSTESSSTPEGRGGAKRGPAVPLPIALPLVHVGSPPLSIYLFAFKSRLNFCFQTQAGNKYKRGRGREAETSMSGAVGEAKKKLDYYKVLGVPRGAGNDAVSSIDIPLSWGCENMRKEVCVPRRRGIPRRFQPLHPSDFFPSHLHAPSECLHAMVPLSCLKKIFPSDESVCPCLRIGRSRMHTGASHCSATPTRRRATPR